MFKIQIGEFTISPGFHKGKICIWRDDGEGGEFNIKDFEEAIRKFYEDNF